MNSSTAQIPSNQQNQQEIDFERRFGGIARLYGTQALARFRAAHVCVIGVGGVGSWAVEALARSAVGKLTLIDLDHVAESNINRQLHALSATLGMAKVAVLAERIAQINPFCEVRQIEEFIDSSNIGELFAAMQPDYVIDAIDDVRAKVALIVYCRAQRIPLVTSGSAGGKTDPTRIEICDLSRTEQEPLLSKVRKRLRQQHGFPRGVKNKFGINAVYSTEPLMLPDGAVCENVELDSADSSDEIEGQGSRSSGAITGLNCDGFGSAAVITASFGLFAASHVLNQLTKK